MYFFKIDAENTNLYSSLNCSISFSNGVDAWPWLLDIIKHFGKKLSIVSFCQRFKFFKLVHSPTFVVNKLLLLK